MKKSRQDAGVSEEENVLRFSSTKAIWQMIYVR